ncbi:hypothetical protein BOX15_Mlig012698g1 [Macrostomum lignano]|uniref:RING-type domain-containing protein n=1 Tax=Macrostomum lignano TaxID=282301 RepID=A0A267E7H8_9PLAT|nr:hypothetical protein BOX15_Mlig012698g1 [Macrostomum lignano]
MATTQAGKLVQEIHDEFLVCKICMSPFKTPKCLSCLHTFCEVCIENHIASEAAYKKYSDYREFTCPLCRKRTQLPVGGAKKLPDNFLISNLSDTMDRQQKSGTSSASCDICKMVGRRAKEQASSKCLDCNKLLCRACVEQHKETKVTRDHAIFDVETEKDIICKDHPDEVVRFYCEPCQACVCIICAFNEHKEHEVSNFSEAVVKYKADIEAVLADCKSKIGVYEKYMERVNSTERQITEAEKKIRELAIEFVADIRNREKQLIDEVHNLYGKQTMEVIGRKAELQSALETLKSTCALTEIVLQGKDIELLLLKREVQDKLSSLSMAMQIDLPKTMSKEIRFLPGHIELGSIQDMDKPNASKFRSCIISNSSFSSLNSIDTVGQEEQPELQSTETQTEPVEFLLESVDFTPTRDVGQFSSGSCPAAAQMESASTQTEFEAQYRSGRDQQTATEELQMEEKAVNTTRPSRAQAGEGGEAGRRNRRAETVNGQQQEQQQQQQQQQQEQQSGAQSGFMSRRRRRMQYGMSLDDDMGSSAL